MWLRACLPGAPGNREPFCPRACARLARDATLGRSPRSMRGRCYLPAPSGRSRTLWPARSFGLHCSEHPRNVLAPLGEHLFQSGELSCRSPPAGPGSSATPPHHQIGVRPFPRAAAAARLGQKVSWMTAREASMLGVSLTWLLPLESSTCGQRNRTCTLVPVSKGAARSETCRNEE